MTLTRRHAAFTRSTRLAVLVTLFGLTACGIGVDDEDRLARGQQAYDSGDYRAAIVEAKNVLKSDANNLDARLLLGRASLLLGDGRSAEKESVPR